MSRKTVQKRRATSSWDFSEMAFGEVDALLAGTNYIASDKRTAFQARLKNLLRVGPQIFSPTGRGIAKAYTASDVFLLAFAIELTQFGLAPASVIDMIYFSRADIARAVLRVIQEPDEKAVLFAFDPDSLRPLMEKFAPGCFTIKGEVCSPVELRDGLESRTLPRSGRLALVDVSRFLSGLCVALDEAERNGASFLNLLGDWAAARLEEEHLRMEAARERAKQGIADGDDPQA